MTLVCDCSYWIFQFCYFADIIYYLMTILLHLFLFLSPAEPVVLWRFHSRRCSGVWIPKVAPPQYFCYQVNCRYYTCKSLILEKLLLKSWPIIYENIKFVSVVHNNEQEDSKLFVEDRIYFDAILCVISIWIFSTIIVVWRRVEVNNPIRVRAS